MIRLYHHARVWHQASESFTVGRNPHGEQDMEISHAAVSRRHARIVFTNGAWWLVDLSSTNGTTIGGKTLSTYPVQIHDGDKLRFGGVGEFTVRL